MQDVCSGRLDHTYIGVSFRWWFCSQKLQEQNERAELLKDRLRWEQQELRMRLQQLQGGTERMRNDSLGSAMSSERSDSDRGNRPVVRSL